MSEESSGDSEIELDCICGECSDISEEELEELEEKYGESSTDHSGQRTEDPEGSSKQATNKLREPPNPDAVIYHSTLDYSGNRFASLEVENTVEDEHRKVKEKLYSGQTIADWLQQFLKEKVGEGIEKWQNGDYDMPESRFAESFALQELENELQNLGEVFDPE